MLKKLANKIPPLKSSPYSVNEEILHSVIHGLGMVLGVVGLTVLMLLAGFYGTRTHFVAYLIYGLSIIALYTASTLYHAIPALHVKKLLKVCDHGAIYLLIAGSYTPFLAINIKGWVGWTMMAIIWSLALAGIIFKFFYAGRFKLLSTLIYLGMGWLVVFAAKPLVESLSPQGLYWMVAGGLTYSVGTIFYLMKNLRFTHAIWHLFVLLGSIFHFIAVLYSTNMNF